MGIDRTLFMEHCIVIDANNISDKYRKTTPAHKVKEPRWDSKTGEKIESEDVLINEQVDYYYNGKKIPEYNEKTNYFDLETLIRKVIKDCHFTFDLLINQHGDSVFLSF